MTQADYQAQNRLLEAIDNLITIRLQEFKNTGYEIGSITSVNTDGTYDIRIRDTIWNNTSAIAGTYEKNDVVWMLKINDDISYRKIMCKV